ncbi:hypothetical protein ABZ468_49130 [Streptomyces sp. NPDC005708]|uniref:hypothetical protein n=1 Tax=Streptomyces sp. NPDC005708 TaxID=3154564 RepID=UPI0033C1E446
MDRNYLLSWKRGHRHDWELELIVLPVSVDRAKDFCEALGFRLDVDCTANEGCRVVRFTDSECSIIFGDAMTAAAPGSIRGLHLIVSANGAGGCGALWTHAVT